MAIESLLPEHLDFGVRQQIIDRLEAERLQIVLAAICDVLAFGGAANPVSSFLIAMNRLLEDNAARALDCARHWSVQLFVPRSLCGEEAAHEAFDRLIGSLLFERLSDGRSPLEGLQFQTRCLPDGSLPAFIANTQLFIRNFSEPFAELNWECGSRMAIISQRSNPSLKVGLPLPILDDAECSDIELRAFPCSLEWGFPLIANGADLLPTYDNVAYFDASRPDQIGRGGAFELCGSLSKAHELLLVIWPEIIDWAKLLIPAIADVGLAPNPNTHFSGSFGPGLPVYLSHVRDPALHAEDLVHELQHHRFLFAIPASTWFGRWKHENFISPYRDDPRPLSGLYLGLHAFIAVNEFRLRSLAKGMVRTLHMSELLWTHRQNLFAFRTIVSFDRLASEAECFLRDIFNLLKQHSDIIEPIVDAQTTSRVETILARHVKSVRARAPNAENQNVSFGAFNPDDFQQAEFHMERNHEN
jgi:hypothetical protein